MAYDFTQYTNRWNKGYQDPWDKSKSRQGSASWGFDQEGAGVNKWTNPRNPNQWQSSFAYDRPTGRYGTNAPGVWGHGFSGSRGFDPGQGSIGGLGSFASVTPAQQPAYQPTSYKRAMPNTSWDTYNAELEDWKRRRAVKNLQLDVENSASLKGGDQAWYDEKMEEWDNANPRPSQPTYVGPRSSSSGGGTQIGGSAMPTDPVGKAAYKTYMQNLNTVPELLLEQWGNVANHGLYNREGMETILRPVESAERRVMRAMPGFMESQNLAGRESLAEGIDYRRAEGANQRRQAISGLGQALGGRVATQPGVSAKMMAEAGAGSMGQQASDIFGAQSGLSAEERAREADTFNAINSLGMGMGARRSNLTQENMASKLQGLSGMQNALGLQANLMGGRYWDTTDPTQKQYAYSSAMNTQMAGIQQQRDYLQQGFSQMNAQQQAELQKMLLQYEHDLNKPGAFDTFLQALAGGANAYASTHGVPTSKPTGGN